VNGDAVGWVSVAPREEYKAILASPQYKPREERGGDAVWSIVCFVVDKPLRARGIASALLAGVVEYAFAHGATSVEAYPHVTGERDYTGHTELCARAGFRHVLNANRRAIVRLEAAT
jgi:GNAT superfamily N-acetyltransferase